MTVDDHPLVQEGIAALVNNQPDMEIVALADSAESALESFRSSTPDIVLMDLRLGSRSGIDIMESLLGIDSSARVVILTMIEGDVGIRRALKAGAKGYVFKSLPPKELLQVIRSVYAGRKYIPPEIASQLAEYYADDAPTSRELEVLQLVAEGLRNREIAAQLFIAEDTVKVHVKRIMDKLGANDRTQAVAIAIRRGIIDL